MTAKLSNQLLPVFSKASEKELFFDESQLRTLSGFDKLEQPLIGSLANGCKTDLYFGFFFDGTKNNYILAEKTKTHSNVARLYDCFPGQSVPGVLPPSTDWQYNRSRYMHFFRTYIPGVVTPFREVLDSGEGVVAQMGAASGYLAEPRIVWALLQAMNKVHRYFFNTPLLTTQESDILVRSIGLDQTGLKGMTPWADPVLFQRKVKDADKAMLAFEKLLQRLHRAVAQHWPDKKTGRPAKIDPGIVQKIHVSIFGFSRGATQARAFTNWLIALCKLDAHLCGKGDKMTLGGFDVVFDFLGIFDAVASIGTGNTLGNSYLGMLFDGHGSWADAEVSLRVPDNIACLHLVAAHELRRSFPLDSVSVRGAISSNCVEMVFPGVHSDIGCGYAPGEQGRGQQADGSDMLTRIPLLVMYRSARLSGVPLKLELANAEAKSRFAVTPGAIDAFNRYIAACATKNGTLTAIMREQQNYQMQWRLLRRTSEKAALEASASSQRACTFDQNDLHSANLEFDAEIAQFNAWLSGKGKGFRPAQQDPGFDNEHKAEWEEIARWWHAPPKLPPAITTFFDEYVHDSRAWFKLIPGNTDNEADLITLLKRWEAQRLRAFDTHAAYAKRFVSDHAPGARQRTQSMLGPEEVVDGLTDEQRAAGQEYARTGKLPNMITTGREPYQANSATYFLSSRGGYLRYRKIYSGADFYLISQNAPAFADPRGVA